ncbi:MAG TPA: hypothetical protein VEX41_08755 [Candidatus Eisenbacteria bacterium]|nr:hypothetical protein [Candidatus Eisenbacteria bacterium]
MAAPRPARNPINLVVRVLIVALTLATAYIHSTLGGLLFTLNAAGYVVAALAMVVPLGLAIRFRWLVRLGLIGYAATAIIAWYLTGPRYDVAYAAKAIEVALIALLAIDLARNDGNPIPILRAALGALARSINRQRRTPGRSG